MERLVKGRERIYLDRFWNDFSADPKHFDEEPSRQHYARLYARPGAMHSGFEQFHAFDQDAIDNKAFLAKGPLPMPVLAIGGGKNPLARPWPPWPKRPPRMCRAPSFPARAIG